MGLYILRLAIAAIFIYHGLPKLMKAGMMSSAMGMAPGMVWLLGLVETLSSLALILGVWLQPAAALLGLIMVGAIYFKAAKWKTGFSAMDKTGWEFDFILLAANIAILLTGGGNVSLL